MIQRIDQLTAPAEVGRYYLVPTVRGTWMNMVRDWPVIGPKHHDRHCLEFAIDHYHLDARFLPGPRPSSDFWSEFYWRRALGAPLHVDADGRKEGPLPAPVWRRRLCKRPANPFLDQIRTVYAHPARNWQCQLREWAGRQAARDGRGWVCPHRGVGLADQPVIDGVITCPLHLLRIDAASGRVLAEPLDGQPSPAFDPRVAAEVEAALDGDEP